MAYKQIESFDNALRRDKTTQQLYDAATLAIYFCFSPQLFCDLAKAAIDMAGLAAYDAMRENMPYKLLEKRRKAAYKILETRRKVWFSR